MTPPLTPEALAAIGHLTCQCGARMARYVAHRPLDDPAYPRETFEDVEVLMCPTCNLTKETRLNVGH